MGTLQNKITSATTSEELQSIVNSIKKQANGFSTALASHLRDAFWYTDLTDDLQKQKDWMIKIVNSY